MISLDRMIFKKQTGLMGLNYHKKIKWLKCKCDYADQIIYSSNAFYHFNKLPTFLSIVG